MSYRVLKNIYSGGNRYTTNSIVEDFPKDTATRLLEKNLIVELQTEKKNKTKKEKTEIINEEDEPQKSSASNKEADSDETKNENKEGIV